MGRSTAASATNVVTDATSASTSSDTSGGLAGELAQRHHLRPPQCLQREQLVGEIQARLDAVQHIRGARLQQHRLRIARDRQYAVLRQAQRIRALRDATQLGVLRRGEFTSSLADCGSMRAVFGDATDDYRDVRGIAKIDLTQR